MKPYAKGFGHHIHIKSAFRNAAGYVEEEALALPVAYMRSQGWDHIAMSAKQRSLCAELLKSGRPNTWKEQNRIAVESLMAGHVPEDVARSLVAASIADLRKKGVRGPSRIPWEP
jgi:hypothetical protein